MPKLKEEEEEAMLLQGQANILHYTYNFVEIMALKCAVELGIADIINSDGQPLTVHRSNHSTNCPAVHKTSITSRASCDFSSRKMSSRRPLIPKAEIPSTAYLIHLSGFSAVRTKT